MMTSEEEKPATLEAIVALVFQGRGTEALRELLLKPEFVFFKDEIVSVGDKLLAHDLKDVAEAVYAMAGEFPEMPTTNPFSKWNPNWIGWKENRRSDQRDRLRIERGLEPMSGTFIGERPRSGGNG